MLVLTVKKSPISILTIPNTICCFLCRCRSWRDCAARRVHIVPTSVATLAATSVTSTATSVPFQSPSCQRSRPPLRCTTTWTCGRTERSRLPATLNRPPTRISGRIRTQARKYLENRTKWTKKVIRHRARIRSRKMKFSNTSKEKMRRCHGNAQRASSSTPPSRWLSTTGSVTTAHRSRVLLRPRNGRNG